MAPSTTESGKMKLTDEQIAKLIYEAYRTGRAEGMEIGQKDGYADGLLDGDAEGYERGYEEGWDKGYDAAEKGMVGWLCRLGR